MAQVAKGGLPFSIAAGQQIPGEMALSKVVFNPSGATDSFILQDANGKLVLQGKVSAVATQPYDFSTPIEVNGLGCAQLSAGATLLVYPA
jgi:hypothetical protein